MFESLFNKVAGVEACNFILKRFQLRCFPVNIVKFFKNISFYRTSPVAVSVLSKLTLTRFSKNSSFSKKLKTLLLNPFFKIVLRFLFKEVKNFAEACANTSGSGKRYISSDGKMLKLHQSTQK